MKTSTVYFIMYFESNTPTRKTYTEKKNYLLLNLSQIVHLIALTLGVILDDKKKLIFII